MTEYDNGDCEEYHPNLNRRKILMSWEGVNLIDGKYIWRLSEKGVIFINSIG